MQDGWKARERRRHSRSNATRTLKPLKSRTRQIAQEVVPACSLQQVSSSSTDPARDPELSLGSVLPSPQTTRAPPCTRDAGNPFFAEEGSLQDLCSSANAAVQQLHRSCYSIFDSTFRCRSSRLRVNTSTHPSTEHSTLSHKVEGASRIESHRCNHSRRAEVNPLPCCVIVRIGSL
jgi:hypothetical protein